MEEDQLNRAQGSQVSFIPLKEIPQSLRNTSFLNQVTHFFTGRDCFCTVLIGRVLTDEEPKTRGQSELQGLES